MRTLFETSLLQLLTHKSNSAYAHDKQTGYPYKQHVSMARTHMHITCTLDDICLTYRVLEYLAWSPAHSVHHPSASYTTIFEPKSTAQRVSSNTTQVQFLTTTALLYSPPYPQQQVTTTTNMTDMNSTSKYFAYS